MDRAVFQAKVGLVADRDFVVFLGSSRFIAEDEVPVVLRWAKALRECANLELAQIGILIRPHPQNYGKWMDIDLSDIGNAVIYPRGGANPVGRDAKSEYFDTMYHCKAVVGVNTSGMIEASILGKPVHTVLFEEMAATQSGTLHFQHLSDEDTGLLRVARNLDEHIDMLSRSLADPSEDRRRSKAFVERFVWPKSLGTKTPVEASVGAIRKQLQSPSPSRGLEWLPLIWLGRILASPLLLIYVREHRRRERRRAIELAKAQTP